MPFDHDEEARIITISLLDFFRHNTIERLKDYVWKKPEKVAFESPLRSLISYSYTINSVIENLMRSMGKESYSVSKDLITIDEIMSLL